MTGAPVVGLYCRMDDRAHYQLEFLPGYHVPSSLQEEDEAIPWVQAALEALEDRVRLHPASSNEYFFWNGPEPAGAAVTEHRRDGRRTRRERRSQRPGETPVRLFDGRKGEEVSEMSK